MILFPNAKINIGLNIVEKRTDGFHNLETLFYPIQLSDILELNRADSFRFTQTGLTIDGNCEDNLAVKAYKLMKSEFSIGDVEIHLHKIVPFGAGLGGGSADAAFTILGLNDLFHLNLSLERMALYAEKLGSDCPFFIYNRPMIGTGKGEILNSIPFSIKGLIMILIKPNISVPTAEAYSKVAPVKPKTSLEEMLNAPIKNWKGSILNQFEESVFIKFPEIGTIKNQFYQLGAIYASMTGSGSAVFGLFETDPGELELHFNDCFYWKETCL